MQILMRSKAVPVKKGLKLKIGQCKGILNDILKKEPRIQIFLAAMGEGQYEKIQISADTVLVYFKYFQNILIDIDKN